MAKAAALSTTPHGSYLTSRLGPPLANATGFCDICGLIPPLCPPSFMSTPFSFPVSIKGTENTGAYDTLPHVHINHNIHSHMFTHVLTHLHTSHVNAQLCTCTHTVYPHLQGLCMYMYKHAHACTYTCYRFAHAYMLMDAHQHIHTHTSYSSGSHPLVVVRGLLGPQTPDSY